MLKKMVLWLLAGCLVLGVVTGCSDDENWDELEDEAVEQEADEQEADEQEQQNEGNKPRKFSMSVSRSSGTMSITRPTPGGTLPDTSDEPAWTIFIYMCATDLESEDGMATADLAEMVAAGGSDDVRLIVETGGCKRWQGDAVSGTGLQRFVIQNGSINEVGSVPAVSMGKSGTLADFLTWGVANYPSERMGVVLWNHGGGSITGVCFDEEFNDDALTLTEVDKAFKKTFATMGGKFEFIGFDACLMATVETANVTASYANYQYGSEELESGTGWDYEAVVSYLAEHPEADGAALGKVVCDSYQASCVEEEDAAIATFSIIDLARIDDLMVSFNEYAHELYEVTDDASLRGQVTRAVTEADNYGGNNRAEGYTNMVDLGGVIEAGSSYTDASRDAQKALDKAVVTHVEGETHEGASGLSIYYPLKVQEANELSTFEDVCVSPYYLSFVDRTTQEGAGIDDYDDDTWFEDDFWEWGGGDDDTYWDFLDGYDQTGESEYITFAVEPEIDEDGIFWFQLDQNGINNAVSVCAYVYELSEDGSDFIELGETADVDGSWDDGAFYDGFDGYWLSLPDGQNLATYIVDMTDDYVVYTSPILLNGIETNLRMRQYFDSKDVVVEGTWDGISASGAAAREVVKLVKGDVIEPVYDAYGVEDEEMSQYLGDPYTVRGTTDVDYQELQGSEYDYSFCIDDIYGDYLMTDYETFYIEDDGSISFAY